jgi:hypothetical protein
MRAAQEACEICVERPLHFLSRADARTRTGDPFITSVPPTVAIRAYAGLLVALRCPKFARKCGVRDMFWDT